MTRSKKIYIAKAVTVLAVPVIIFGYAEGPPIRKTGAPGDALCTNCHTGTANTGGGKVEVAFPKGLTYSPGVKQQLTVTVTDSAAVRFGFQLTARLASNETNGQAGELDPAGTDTQVFCDDGNLNGHPSTPKAASGCSGAVEFIEHTLAGAPNTFKINWTPPAAAAGNVHIYVAGNAANGNFRPDSGDHIYTANYVLTPAGSTSDKPQITSVVNGASFQPGISAGSWVTIKGANLASTARTWRADEIVNSQLPDELDDVSVTIDGKPASVYFISSTQVNVLAPSDDNVGPVPVVVKFHSQTSDAFTANLQKYSPGFFQWDKYTVATRPDGSYVGKPGLLQGIATTPAKPGEIVILWGTGFGPTKPLFVSGRVVDTSQLYSAATLPVVRIGDVTAEVVGAALSPGSAGLYQVAIRIPGTVGAGDNLVAAEAGGTASAPGVFLTIGQ
jgi:uncharacterized protein (TIGR03437 family)